MTHAEMLDNLRMLRNMANACKLGQRAAGDEKEAVLWENGALAVEQAIHTLVDAREFRKQLRKFLEE